MILFIYEKETGNGTPYTALSLLCNDYPDLSKHTLYKKLPRAIDGVYEDKNYIIWNKKLRRFKRTKKYKDKDKNQET